MSCNSKYQIYNYFFLALFYTTLLSCKNNNEGDSKLVYLDPNQELSKDWLDNDIENDITYFPLENANQIPLGVLRKFIIVDTFFISTYKNRNGIYFHSNKGKFIHRQNTTGKGPLEFNDVNEIAKYDDKHILINDPEKRSVLKYNLQDWRITEEFKTDQDIFAMHYHNNQLLFIGNDFENGIVQSVDNFNFKDKQPIIKGTKLSNYVVSFKPFELISNDKIAINISFLDTIFIYNLTSREIEKKYAIGKGETSLSHYSLTEIMEAPRYQGANKFEKVLIPWGFLNKIQNYLIFTVIPMRKCIVIDLNNDSSFFMDFKNNTGKLSYLESGVFPGILTNNGKDVFSVFLISDLKKLYTDKRNPKYMYEYNRFYNEKFQNPILAKFTFK